MMASYRNALAQLSGNIYPNDAGLETDPSFNHGIDISEFAAHTLQPKPPRRKQMGPKRRYLGLACALVMTLPALAAAQSPSTETPLIGYLSWGYCKTPSYAAPDFLRGLGDLGYKPGETITIECRSAGQHDDGLAAAAAELVALGVDMIVSTSEPAARAAHKVTDTIPIVSTISGDPVAAGLAQSLAQPGGNVTGVSYYATELTGKRMDLLMKAVPELTTVHVLSNPGVSYLPFEKDTKRAAARLGIAVKIHNVREPTDLPDAISTMKAENAQVVFVLPDMMLAWESPSICALALEHGLAAMTWGFWYANDGCLMAYSAWYPDLEYRLAFYVDRILKGAKPGDLPIEQPTKYVLSINLKTAETLGLKLPPTLLLQADNFIE